MVSAQVCPVLRAEAIVTETDRFSRSAGGSTRSALYPARVSASLRPMNHNRSSSSTSFSRITLLAATQCSWRAELRYRLSVRNCHTSFLDRLHARPTQESERHCHGWIFDGASS